MFYLRFILFSLFVSVNLGVDISAQSESTDVDPEVRLKERIKFQELNRFPATSFILVLAHPQRYSGKRLHLWGWFRRDPEGGQLYLDRECAKNLLPGVSVRLSWDKDQETPEADGFLKIKGEFRERLSDFETGFVTNSEWSWISAVSNK